MTVPAAPLTSRPGSPLLTPIVGYGPAWIGHFFIERNAPATFQYPVWSLRADLKMLALALEGKMAAEVERLHPPASPSATDAPSTTSGVDANGAATV